MAVYSVKRRGALSYNRYVSMILATVTVLYSYTFSLLASPGAISNDKFLVTICLCILASLAAVYLVSTLGKYPGVDRFYYIAPCFLISYSFIMIALIMTRLPYSRLMLVGTFVINIFVYFGLYISARRQTRLKIGLIPQGDYKLVEVPSVEWKILDHPNAPVDDFDAISVDLSYDISDEWERQLANYALRGIPVYHELHLRESLTGKVEIKHLSENNFGTLTPLQTYMGIKQVLDWVLALLTVITMAPAFCLIAILIKLDSPGPAFFRQTRLGYQGCPFKVFKFRTMTIARDKDTDVFAQRDAAMTKDADHRVTRLGRFLRRSRIDELPQLFNVLKGEMSWIGPRPEAEILSRWYENEIPFYRYRHIVRPGITGWAQVHQGHVADIEQVREKLNFDFYYIKNFSPWIDLIIVGRTIHTMLTGFGSR
ncbi:lipopolysaccharide/colanic/teichoic acid biosynthesis glycosyltransferase [Stakelama pacifica]|uniref:Lipopolysaccharide/colanic/teichoic acid biosynthesis glycosyltransferase n=2 Tax=Stakelama pacifica TaxID=517720 RepID=A0A4R6FFR2_9SPHN|nr:lipopolysaccharide/colanic/teichoic acid biosynthesis glycosyltransferase [Stakelama pacifica]